MTYFYITLHDDLGMTFVKQVLLNNAKIYNHRLDGHPNDNAFALLDDSRKVPRLTRDKILDMTLL